MLMDNLLMASLLIVLTWSGLFTDRIFKVLPQKMAKPFALSVATVAVILYVLMEINTDA